MRVRRGILNFVIAILGVVPLHAQFTTVGCPQGPSGPQLDGFTAGTTTSSQICMTGSFQASLPYSITLASPLRTVQLSGTASTTSLVVSVPASFYATVSTPGQSDPVSITISPNGSSGTQTGSFEINPPLASGGPVFISAVNAPVGWTLFTGGTPPYEVQFVNGTVPTGMANFPTSSNTWVGTPSQTGTFEFSVLPTDGWGNQISDELGAYILATPQIAQMTPNSAPIGSSAVTVTIVGSGFVAPTTVNSTPEPGTTVQVTSPTSSLPVTLTPKQVTASQLTVSFPASLFTTEGYLIVTANDLNVTYSNTEAFAVYPVITALSTVIRTAGAPPFPLGVTGAGFAPGAVVQMNGTSLPTTFVNSGSLTATFPSDSTIGPVLITVQNLDETVSPPATLTIAPAPTATSLNPASANAGGPAFQLLVNGSRFQTGMTVYFNSIPVSTTLVQNQQNNMLMAAIPASAIASAGTVPVVVTTVDGYATPALYFTIVSTGPPPLQLLTLSPLPPGMVGVAYSDTFMATGGAGGYTFAITGGTPPAGLQLSSAGVLSGSPTAYGSSQFTVQLSDSAGSTVPRTFTLTIAPAPLSLTTPPLSNVTVNTAVNVQFAGTGGEPPYTFVEFGALPPGLSFSSAGLLSGTPTKAGSYPFQVYIDDTNQAYASKNYTLNIANPGLLITPPSPLPAGQVNVPYTTQLAATGGVGTPYTWSATGLPQGLNIANNSGLIAGIPVASGTFSVAVTVGDRSGATDTQTYTMVIASAKVTITTVSLQNGAVGNVYNQALAASGGSQTYTFTATGLPPGLTLSPYGTLTGTPTTAGPYTIAVTATDASGLTGTANLNLTIVSKVSVTSPTTVNATLGSALAPVQLSASGGTPPYQWQAVNLPPGLTLSSSGALSGTPTLGGSFTFTVYAVDSNGALASTTVQATVAFPSAPSLSISGLPASNAPATQPSIQVSLASPYPANLTAILTLTFAPVTGADDPSIQFSTGGRTTQISIPANTTGGLSQVGIQTGTVAGTITVTAQLLSGSQNVTPTPAPSFSAHVNATVPVITSISATPNGSGFTVTIVGYSSSRDLSGATYQFNGSSLSTGQLQTSLSTLFSQWYASSSSAPFGSQFTLIQPFSVSGSPSAVQTITVTLTNSVGTSQSATAALQ